ncbi:unnamed protein product [Macrosiphum euphorbiae]|uniref:Uncharacterized protein n=1 Tax=Macrosiphum euphorbiae TaxID=13131 RepID=A0AAV0XNX1_9HEMI|nr:unnamed protein product [Macrosiphum euphorbiae]
MKTHVDQQWQVAIDRRRAAEVANVDGGGRVVRLNSSGADAICRERPSTGTSRQRAARAPNTNHEGERTAMSVQTSHIIRRTRAARKQDGHTTPCDQPAMMANKTKRS